MAKKSTKKKLVLKYWAVLVSGQTRITTKKVATAKEACLDLVGMANGDMQAMPLSTRVADVQNSKWLATQLANESGWERPEIKSSLGTDYS